LHRGVYYNYDLLINWDVIHLYLVTANKFLTNLLKAMLSLNHNLLISLTLHIISVLMHIISHTCWAMNVCELTLVITPTSEKQVPPKEDYYDEFDEI
jgi:hypothetical protein